MKRWWALLKSSFSTRWVGLFANDMSACSKRTMAQRFFGISDTCCFSICSRIAGSRMLRKSTDVRLAVISRWLFLIWATSFKSSRLSVDKTLSAFSKM